MIYDTKGMTLRCDAQLRATRCTPLYAASRTDAYRTALTGGWRLAPNLDDGSVKATCPVCVAHLAFDPDAERIGIRPPKDEYLLFVLPLIREQISTGDDAA